MVRKIVVKVPDKTLQEDLEKYRQRALELGATDAKIITTDTVVIDDRVRAKCIYPKCTGYGTNANCPPYAMELDQVRRVVNGFKYAIFYTIQVPSELLAGQEAREKKLMMPSRIKNHEIASKLEAEAFFDGYHLALGFAGGDCKNIFCPNIECSALIRGQACRHALKARASMEGVGMDVFTMAANVGWDIYPIGASILPSQVPLGRRLGIVLIH